MVGRACSQAPSPHIMSEQGENRQGVGLNYQTQRPSCEIPPPKVFTVFKTVPPTEKQVFKMSLWGMFSTLKLKQLIKPSLVWRVHQDGFPQHSKCSCFFLY